MSFLLIDQNLPYAISLAVGGALVVLELLGLILGSSPSEIVDEVLPFDLDGVLPSGWMARLGVEGYPTVLWMLTYGLCFGVAGLTINAVAEAAAGVPLGWFLSIPPAALFGLVLSSQTIRAASWLLPSEESTATDANSMEGLSAVIREGIARKGHPAQARLQDVHGQLHFPMVEPLEDGVELRPGDDVILVRRSERAWQVVKEGKVA